MKKLPSAKVFRSGRTVRDWHGESSEVKLFKDELAVMFSIKSKGGGITDLKVALGAEDFADILEVMVKVDRSRMLREITSVLKAELERQTERDRITERNGRWSVIEAAERALEQAPAGRKHAERLVYETVKELVARLNADEDEKEGPSAA